MLHVLMKEHLCPGCLAFFGFQNQWPPLHPTHPSFPSLFITLIHTTLPNDLYFLWNPFTFTLGSRGFSLSESWGRNHGGLRAPPHPQSPTARGFVPSSLIETSGTQGISPLTEGCQINNNGWLLEQNKSASVQFSICESFDTNFPLRQPPPVLRTCDDEKIHQAICDIMFVVI